MTAMAAEKIWLARAGGAPVGVGPVLLAPMEGITDPVFRHLVCGLGGVGAAVTEFVRVTVAPVPAHVIRTFLGPPLPETPVAVQLMASAPDHLAVSAARAEAGGAAWIDLNFGCPAPTVFAHCAGSALLADPDRMASLIRAARAGTRLPVSAKMRAGITDPHRVEELCLAAAEAGAALITVHGRLRTQPYSQAATWAWIARAAAVLRPLAVPLCGNGSVDRPTDVMRMRAETGCDAVMIGRAALADPWIFRQAAGGPPATPAEAHAFVIAYHDAVAALRGPRAALAKLKQLITYWRAGGWAPDAAARRGLLRLDAAAGILAALAPGSGGAHRA
jgi:tRNA-dihydrouridine synthase